MSQASYSPYTNGVYYHGGLQQQQLAYNGGQSPLVRTICCVLTDGVSLTAAQVKLESATPMNSIDIADSSSDNFMDGSSEFLKLLDPTTSSAAAAANGSWYNHLGVCCVSITTWLLHAVWFSVDTSQSRLCWWWCV